MKSISLGILFFFITSSAFAQKKDKWHPFSNMPDISWYVEGSSKFGQVTKEPVTYLGFKGGLVWSPYQAVGISFNSTVNKFTPSMEPDKAVYLRNVLSGVYYEYMLRPDNKLHFTFPIATGAGELYYDWKELDKRGVSSFPYEEEFYFYIEPAVRAEYNIAPNWRVHVGASYLVAPFDFDYRGITASSVTGPTVHFGVRFGRFFLEKRT